MSVHVHVWQLASKRTCKACDEEALMHILRRLLPRVCEKQLRADCWPVQPASMESRLQAGAQAERASRVGRPRAAPANESVQRHRGKR